VVKGEDTKINYIRQETIGQT